MRYQQNAQQPHYLQSWPRKVSLRAKKNAVFAVCALECEDSTADDAEGRFDHDDSPLCPHAVKQVFVQESQLRKKEKKRAACVKKNPNLTPSSRRRT